MKAKVLELIFKNELILPALQVIEVEGCSCTKEVNKGELKSTSHA